MPAAQSTTQLLLSRLRHRLARIGTIFVSVYFTVATVLYFLEHNVKDTHFEKYGDALWFCVVTMSTVGYGDVFPITAAGRFITGGFILFTLGTLGLLITAVSEAVTEVKHMEETGQIGTRMKDHVLVCGFNSMTRAALVELLAAEKNVAVLCEKLEELPLVRDALGKHERLFITSGEPTQDMFRDRLNAAEADAAVIGMHDDAKNLIATLNLKAVHPEIRLVVALQRDELRQTLIAGGVTYVASPNDLSGRLVASAAFEPEVAQLVDDVMSGALGSCDMQQYQVGQLGGLTVAEVRAKLEEIDGPLLIGVAKEDGGAHHYRLMPHPDRKMVLETHDHIIVLATKDQAARLSERYQVKQGREPSPHLPLAPAMRALENGAKPKAGVKS